MHSICLSDELFQEAKRRAAECGFPTVDEYVVSVLERKLFDDTKKLDHLFTPERLAEIDLAAAQTEAGQYFTSVQVREHFKRK